MVWFGWTEVALDVRGLPLGLLEPAAVAEAAFRPVGEPIARLLAQKVGGSSKLYALHAPEVECIAKGKARTCFEFGVKASFAVTNARAGGGQFIVGAQARPGLPL